MANELATVTIQGTSALLMHRFPLEPLNPPLEKRTKEDQAEVAAYRDADGNLYVEAIAVQRALVAAGGFSKGKGRATLQKPVAACVQVSPEHLLLGTKEYDIDSRAVVVPATKGRVVRHRPRLDKWELTFDLEWDPNLLTAVQMRTVVDDTGTRVGLLDFRPERKGPFGRFTVINWDA